MEELKKYCKNRKLITFKCDCCGKEAQKPLSEYNRNIKLNRKNFCSRECVGKYNDNLSKADPEKVKETQQNIKLHCANRRDELTPFKYTFRCVKRRYKDIDITLEDLKQVWDNQNGICPYTGLKLTLPENGNIHDLDITIRASLDRIDSNLGYIKNNIQFVSTPINFMKNTMSDSQTKKFLKQISNFTSNLTEY